MLGSTIVIDNGLYKGHISVTFSVFVVKEMGKTYRRITLGKTYRRITYEEVCRNASGEHSDLGTVTYYCAGCSYSYVGCLGLGKKANMYE